MIKFYLFYYLIKESFAKSTKIPLKFKKNKTAKKKESNNYIQLKKKKRIHKFLLSEGIQEKEKSNQRSRSKTVEDFGKSSEIAFTNLHKNLNEQNKSIFDRLRQRKER